jgi:hypothetical protein
MSNAHKENKERRQDSLAESDDKIRVFGNTEVNIITGKVVSHGTPSLIVPEEYFSKDRGPVGTIDTRNDPTDLVRRFVTVIFLSGDNIPLPVISVRQAFQTHNLLVEYIGKFGYVSHIMHYGVEFGNFRKTLDDLKSDVRLISAVNSLPVELPKEAPAKWPGARRADLVGFLTTTYGPYIGKGLTMAHIKGLDEPLYWAIHYAKKTHSLPPELELPSRPQLLRQTLQKFFKEGEAALTAHERTAVARKAKRVLQAQAASLSQR